jgi:methyl-accepting chemotaxis protein
MKHWTIAKRISLGFTIILLLFAAVAVSSFILLRQVKTQLSLVTNDGIPGLSLAGRLKSNAGEIQLAVLRHILARTPEQKKVCEAQIEGYTATNSIILEEYGRMDNLPEELEILGQLKEARSNYQKNRESILELSRAGKVEEAAEFNLTSLRPAYLAYDQTCDELVAFNVKQCGVYSKSSGNAAYLANTIIVGASVFAVVLGGIIAFITIRNLGKMLSGLANQLDDGSNQVASASSEIASASQSLAEGASEQASSLEETSASLEEMSSMTKRNADSAESAKTLSSETRAAADAGAADMQEMSSAMAEVKAASDNIAKIIKTIDEIAFQTNILALNAAVEAARAGEAGAGFAVVADEVRSLAQRSAQAAKETAEKIENSIQKSHRGAQISEKVTASLAQIVVKARQVDELVGEIAAASKEQAQGIIQVNVAVSQMDKITQSNAASAEESASASEELNAQAAGLKGGVAELSKMVGITTAQIVETPKAVRSKFQGSAKVAGNGHNGHSHGNGHAPIGKTPLSALAAVGGRHTSSIPMEGDFKDF